MLRRRKNLLRVILPRNQHLLAYAQITGIPYTTILQSLVGMPDDVVDIILRVRLPYEE